MTEFPLLGTLTGEIDNIFDGSIVGDCTLSLYNYHHQRGLSIGVIFYLVEGSLLKVMLGLRDIDSTDNI